MEEHHSFLGWEFIVCKKSDVDAAGNTNEAPILARWTASLGADRWIEDLAAAGIATDLGGNGYPNRFVAPAAVVVPILMPGPPKHTGPLVIGDDYVHPGGWSGEAEINLARMSALAPTEMLVIEVWDQS
jgi:hypothetical protein